MKKINLGAIMISLILMACGKSVQVETAPSYTYTVEIVDSSREIVMTNDQPWEAFALNYFNVIRVGNVWKMWYACFENYNNGDYGDNLCYAYSDDGKNWIKQLPMSIKKDNVLIKGTNSASGWVENFVFIDKNDSLTPYKILYSALDANGNQKTFITSSVDGINWIDNKIVFNDKHDTQPSVHILDNGNYSIFLRLWNSAHNERQIGYSIITPDNQSVVSPYSILGGNLYNSAAAYLGNNSYIMFPTQFNNQTQEFLIKIAYIINGNAVLTSQDITSNLFQGTQTKWGLVAPGLISTGNPNEYWLYYLGASVEHNGQQQRASTYYRIKVIIMPKS